MFHQGDIISNKDNPKEQYRILEEPSKNDRHSGMVTYIAGKIEDVSTGKSFFLKYAKNHSLGCEVLKNESRFQIFSPYVAHIYKSFEVDHDIYCVLGEYIEGENLDDYMEQHRDLKEKYFIMLQLLYGVRSYMNYIPKGNTFVHRDLHPANVRINPKSKRITIIDFDWSHTAQSRKTSYMGFLGGGVIAGTPGFSAPEAWHTTETASQMDIYSLGRLFCFLLLEEEYFKSYTNEQLTEMLMSENPAVYSLDRKKFEDIHIENKDILFGIIQKMVARKQERYSSLDGVIKDFEYYLEKCYGKEIFSEWFLQLGESLSVPRERTSKETVRVFYNTPGKESRISKYLCNYQMHDIVDEGRHIMTIYNLDGVVYYIPLAKKIQKDPQNSRQPFAIVDGDSLSFDGKTIKFNIYSRSNV